MKINAHENFVIIKEKSNDLDNFVFLLTPLMPNQLKEKNVIIDMLDYHNFSINDLMLFSNISNIHRAANNSFVIVNNVLNLNNIPEEMVVVPTLQEAEDIVEMESIERELGF